jgi:hypothetical protein
MPYSAQLPQRIHVLRPESITPIGRYLMRRRSDGSCDRQVEYACVLLYREREYRAFYSSSWRPEHLPAPHPEGPFAPFDLTDAAAATLASTVRTTWGLEADAANRREDLFGLKAEAEEGLSTALAPLKGQAFGHLLLSRLLRDLCHFARGVVAAMTALERGCDIEMGYALAYDAAILASDHSWRPEDIGRRARLLLREQGKDTIRWQSRGSERFDEKVRRHALRTRTEIEGDSFQRYLSTEAEFCERERVAALDGFDGSKVPPDLSDLIPIAQRFGIGDDPCRNLVIR